MRKTTYAIIIISLLAIFVTACAPSQTAIQTAIAQTELALPTNTPTFEPSDTNTPEPTATTVPTIAPSPTPDLRVIDSDPKAFLLQQKDLPVDAKYFLPGPGWISPNRNSEVIAARGAEDGRKYLEETGRIDGWWVYYNRGTNTVTAPQEIFNNSILYLTAEGAQLLTSKYGTCHDPVDGYKLLSEDVKIGDTTATCILREMQSNGKNRVWYMVEFTYKNLYQAVHGFGWEDEVRPEYVQAVARTLLAKMEAAPLSDTVTFSP